MTKHKYVYKIRNHQGLYSMGGSTPRFNEKGKTWTTLGHVSLALSNYAENKRSIPADWEVVELETIEVQTFKATDIRTKTVERATAKRASREKKYAEARQTRELAEAERIFRSLPEDTRAKLLKKMENPDSKDIHPVRESRTKGTDQDCG